MTLRLYQHRVNTVEALKQVPLSLGVEFDLRSDGDRVIVTHDPFTTGPEMEDFFQHIGPRPCIFNVKCEGIEARVLDAARRHSIEEFFFLDLSVPAAVKLARAGEKRIAVRYSEYEPEEAVFAWRRLAQWVWVDCFTRYPGNADVWTRMAGSFQLCLVSPELQGRGTDGIRHAKADLNTRPYHAVCTKRPDLWAHES